MSEDIINKFRMFLIDRNYKNSTVDAYVRDSRLLLLHIGGADVLPTVTGEDLFEIVERIRGVKKETGVFRWTVSVRKFFDFCVLNGICGHNPMSGVNVSNPVAGGAKRPEKDVAEKLMETVSEHESEIGLRNQALIAVLCNTELKLTEILNLKVGDFSLIDSKIRYGSYASNKLDRSVAQVLAQYVTYRNLNQDATAQSPLFINYKGSPLSRKGCWKIIKQSVDKAGIDDSISPVKLRNIASA